MKDSLMWRLYELPSGTKVSVNPPHQQNLLSRQVSASWKAALRVVVTCLLLAGIAVGNVARSEMADQKIVVATYYFPDYHPNDPRNVRLKGRGWSEWKLVKEARPRFPGEVQPHIPVWGYLDESDPRVMARKIDAAAGHGIDVFIFDWYYYGDGPFLQGALDDGFLKAKNDTRIRFALMWANHNWLDMEPYKRGQPYKILYPGTVTAAKFRLICKLVIDRYFERKSYWRIDGKPYFSFYDLPNLIANFGSIRATRAALDNFRAMAIAAGLPGLHLNAIVLQNIVLHGEKRPADVPDLVQKLGFDSVTSYVWDGAALPRLKTPYVDVRNHYFQYWDHARHGFHVPDFPVVMMGWDPSPRAYQGDKYGNFGYPFTNTMTANSPEKFRGALLMAKERVANDGVSPRVVFVNAWNEWTEGSYLEPDAINGMGYLDAIRSVFSRSERPERGIQ